jgi:hypothetical protein
MTLLAASSMALRFGLPPACSIGTVFSLDDMLLSCLAMNYLLIKLQLALYMWMTRSFSMRGYPGIFSKNKLWNIFRLL